MITIICDTRQQMRNASHRRKEEYFKSQGCNVMKSKLPIADYARLDNMSVIVDTKDGLAEVCKNLCESNDHRRFRDNCIKAQQNGIKLIVLVEEDQTDENGHYTVNDLNDVYKWQNPRRKIKVKKDGQWVLKYPKATTGAILKKAMVTMSYRYGVRWEFCRKRDAGRRILELLGAEGVAERG